jgi:hypothetical protein
MCCHHQNQTGQIESDYFSSTVKNCMMSGPGSRLTAESYIAKLKGPKFGNETGSKVSSKSQNENNNSIDKTQAVAVVAGVDYINSIPHAPWPSRAMLKVYNHMKLQK